MTQRHFSLGYLLALSGLLLSACGGGGPTTPDTPGISNTPVISRTTATSAIATAKNGGSLLTLDLIAVSDIETVTLPILSDASYHYSTPASLGTNPCNLGGTASYYILKTKSGAGLNAGDYFQTTYNNCQFVSGTPILNGTIRSIALTTTSTDISSANSFSLPLQLIATNYTQTSSGIRTVYNGTVSFSTYSYNSTGSVRSIISSTDSAGFSGVATINSGTLSYSYKNASSTINTAATGALSSTSTMDFSLAVSGQTDTLHTVVSYTAPSAYSTSASFISASYFGSGYKGVVGSMAGTLSGTTVAISIDYGANGSVDDTYSVLHSSL